MTNKNALYQGSKSKANVSQASVKMDKQDPSSRAVYAE
jgi:hypothetical protein